MNAQQRPGQITYYDELGVAPNASPEEIRAAFRALARLLHPDQQTDPLLKDMAEKQMRRLNPIYTALNDPLRRKIYDEDLEDGFAPTIVVGQAPPRDLRRLASRGIWIATIIISAGFLFWFASENPILPVFHDRDARASEPDASELRTAPALVSDPNSPAEVVRLRAELRLRTQQRDAALKELGRIPAPVAATETPGSSIPSAQRSTPSRSLPAMTMTELPVAPKISTALVAPPRGTESAGTGKRLAGFWFYVKPLAGQNNKNKTLYPPEFIEATLTEANGVLNGKYRSRFQIVDRAISPDVNFTFTGTPDGSTVTAPWTGPGGARGEVTLKLMPDSTLQVDWAASEIGSQMGLVSGTAVLSRRLDF